MNSSTWFARPLMLILARSCRKRCIHNTASSRRLISLPFPERAQLQRRADESAFKSIVRFCPMSFLVLLRVIRQGLEHMLSSVPLPTRDPEKTLSNTSVCSSTLSKQIIPPDVLFLVSTAPLHLMSSYQSRVLVRHLPSRTQEGVPRGYFPTLVFVFLTRTHLKNKFFMSGHECADRMCKDCSNSSTSVLVCSHSALFKVSSCHVNARCRDWEGVLCEGAAVECHVTRTFLACPHSWRRALRQERRNPKR